LAAVISVAATSVTRMSAIAATLILARLLTPAEFGIASIGTLVVFLLMPLTDIGIAQALVRGDVLDLPHRARTAFWLVLGLGVGLYGVVFVSAEAAATFFSEKEVADLLRVMGVAVPVYALSRIPSAILERELSFGRKAVPETVASFAYSLIAVALAFLNFGFWSIAIATVARSVLLSVGILMVQAFRPRLLFDVAVAQQLLVYARFLLASSLLRLAYSNIDNAVVGRVLGASALGYYSMAFNLGNFVAVNLSEPVGRVLFPTYAKILPNTVRAGEVAQLALRYASLLISPVTIVGIVAAPAMVSLVLGPGWSPATLPLQILLVYGWARTLAPVHWAFMLAADLNRASLVINVLSLVLAIAAAYPVVLLFGYPGIAAEFALLELLRLLAMAQVVRGRLGVGWRTQLSAVLPGVLASIIAGGALFGIQLVVSPANLIAMAIELALAAFVYVAWLLATGTVSRRAVRRARQVLGR
jgi:PST family polysaccharide transporter